MNATVAEVDALKTELSQMMDKYNALMTTAPHGVAELREDVAKALSSSS